MDVIESPTVSDRQHGEAGSCLEEQTIASYFEGGLSEDDRDQAAAHLLHCEKCRDKLTGLARVGAEETQNYSSVVLDETGTAYSMPASSAGEVLAPGTNLGRYVVLAKVGAGGMGVVYSAFDPELDRQIAIKVIRAEILKDMERAHANLRDEARAMAQLTHPNVVRVYDVGTQGELVYIAMEFIEGEDLLSFAKRQRAKGEWQSIFEACMQAGRGLQAAHDAGLVHRDFKPSNVLVAGDGRAFVVDFGLTRIFSKAGDGGSVGWSSASGTPGYAPPEQLAGDPTDSRSDQYSFCVTVAECLFGRDPRSIFSRLDREQDTELKTPKRLAPLLQRGLAAESGDRYQSMRALLDNLEKSAKPRYRPAIVGASAASLTAVGLLMFVLGGRNAEAADLCAGGAERFEQLWPEQRQSDLDVLLASTKYSKHSTYFLKTTGERSRNLVEQQRLSCEATFVDKTQSAELFDRQMFCLNSLATELESIISMVEGGVSVEVGQSSLSALASVSDCRVSESLLATKAPPSDASSLREIQAVEDLLAERRVLEAARKPEEALKKVELAITKARAIGYGPLLTRVESHNAELLERLERFDEARQAAERARDAASEGRDTRQLIMALLKLASIVNTHEDDADEALAYLATARSLSLGIDLPVLDKVEIEITSGSLAQTNEEHEKSRAYAQAGLELLKPLDEEDSKVQGSKIILLEILASVHFAAGELDKASPLLWNIHELKKKRLGPEHSQLAVTLTNIATVDYQLGKLEDSLATLGRVRELLRSPDAAKADLGQVSSLEALIQNRLGHLPEAIALFQETIEIYKEVFGEDHANIWRTKANLANTYMALQRWEETLEIQRGFAAWATERYGADSPTAIAARLNLATTTVQAHYEDGEVQAGQLLLEELASELPKGHPTLVNIRVMQGNAFLVLKQPADAAKFFEKALKLNESTPNPEPSFTATTTGALAEAMWDAGKRRQSLVVARRALALYDKLSSPLTEYRAEQAKWVKEKESEM